NRGRDDSHQLHRGIEPTPCNDQGVAFTDGDHPETHNYRPACARPSLAAPRRSSLVVQKIYRVAVGVGSDLDDLARAAITDGAAAIPGAFGSGFLVGACCCRFRCVRRNLWSTL